MDHQEQQLGRIEEKLDQLIKFRLDHENRIRDLEVLKGQDHEKRLTSQAEKIAILEGALLQLQGGWKLVLIVGGFCSAVATLITWAISQIRSSH